MGIRPKLVGRKFGKLKVIQSEYVNNRNGRNVLKWRCLCDCGNTTFQPSYMLTQGHTKHCGCEGKRIKKLNLLNHVYIPGSRPKPNAESAKNNVFLEYKISARKKGIPFTLSKNYLLSITDKNCFYCNSTPSNIKKSRYSGEDYIYNGLDRIVPEKGYVPENVVPCCFSCNAAKNTKTQEEFYTHILKIVNHLKLK